MGWDNSPLCRGIFLLQVVRIIDKLINKIICGDVLEVLKTMPDECVHCVVTSPPYWSLRDYGVEGQLGLEKTPKEYVMKLVAIFREVCRVLRSDGTVWLNLGDSYWGSGQSFGDNKTTNKNHRGSRERQKPEWFPCGLKPKDLSGIPWRVAFALQADGWWLRCDVIWYKPNPMPESVRDRPTKSHEYLFLLTKSAKYYYDQEAIREEGSVAYRGSDFIPKSTKDKTAKTPTAATGASWNNRTDDMIRSRNARSVWTIATQPYPEAHFATYPEKLVEPCIKAGTSDKGCCPKCGTAWVRILKTTRSHESGSGKAGKVPIGKNPNGVQGGGATLDVRMGPCVNNQTLGWRPSCDCVESGIPDFESNKEAITMYQPESMPCIVLDPFIGSGTTAVVAKGLGRNYIGIELNPEYVKLAEKRIAKTNARQK